MLHKNIFIFVYTYIHNILLFNTLDIYLFTNEPHKHVILAKTWHPKWWQSNKVKIYICLHCKWL